VPLLIKDYYSKTAIQIEDMNIVPTCRTCGQNLKTNKTQVIIAHERRGENNNQLTALHLWCEPCSIKLKESGKATRTNKKSEKMGDQIPK
jgi:hypothetical protein